MRRGHHRHREHPEELDEVGGHEECCDDTSGSLLESFRDACTDPALADLMRNAGLFSVQAGMAERDPE